MLPVFWGDCRCGSFASFGCSRSPPLFYVGFAACGKTSTMRFAPAQNYTKRKKTENRKFSVFFGGDKRDRTADLLNAIQALSRYRQKHTPCSPLQAKKTLRSQNGTAIIHTDIFCIISKCIKAKNFLLLKACKISVFSHRL